MGEPFVENTCEAINYLTEKYWDRGYDAVTSRLGIAPQTTISSITSRRGYENVRPAVTSDGTQRRQKNRLPSPEGSIESWDRERYREQVKAEQRDHSLDRESLQSEQVLRAYEADPSDPIRRPQTVFVNDNNKDSTRRDRKRDDNMSYQNGSLAPGQYQQQRANSAQPPRNRYYDDDDEYGSDYDDRRGGRYQNTGRGYDDRDRDYGYDDRGGGGGGGGGDYREVIETERYRGPARDFDQRRQSFRSNQNNDPYSGAVTQYNQQQRRSTTDIDTYRDSRRSRSRGRRGSERDRGSRSRSRSYSRSRSRSRSGSRGLGDKVGQHFDTSLQGIGFGLAGAVVGGMAGRHFGDRNPRHKNRDILIGALVGGLGANAAETKWNHWQEDKKDKVREDEEKWEQKWDGYSGRDYGRSRSAMR